MKTDGEYGQMVPVSDLREDPINANVRESVEDLKASLLEFGQHRPIVVKQDGTIIVGNHTFRAAVEIGWQEVWAYRVDDDGAKAVRRALADNRTSELRWFDDRILLDQLMEFDGATIPGFDETFLKELSARVDPLPGEEKPLREPSTNPVSRTGDLWCLGEHRLLCGDSTNMDDVTRLLDGQAPDMTLTDPPYGMRLDTDFSTIKGAMGSIGRTHGTQGNTYARVVGDHDDFSPALITAIFERFGAPEMFLFGADYYVEHIPAREDGSWLVWDKRKESQTEAIGSEFELCWSRQRHKRRILRHDWFGFLSSGNTTEARNRVHPTQKPSSLLRDIISQWGKDARVIADPFLGSGTTLIAAHAEGRVCYAIEIDPAYVDVSVERWQEFTKQVATLDGDGRSFAEVESERLAPNPMPDKALR